MFQSSLANLDTISELPERVVYFIQQVKKQLQHNCQVGSYPLDSADAYYFIASIETLSLKKTKSEIHHKYLDVQIILEGEETFGYSLSPFRSIADNQLDTRDVAFSEDIVDEQFTTLASGDFIVFFPHQPHRPMVASSTPTKVKKAVIKIEYPAILEQ